MKKVHPLTMALVAGAMALCPLMASASSHPSAKPAEKTTGPNAWPTVTTQGSVNVNGKNILYTAVAGTIAVGGTDAQDAQLGPNGKPLPDSNLASQFHKAKQVQDQPPVAHMFYVAYFERNANEKTRPITFLYNGGPGSSSVWLHMGAFGPKRVATGNWDTHLPPAPYKLENNTNSLLDVSDLVFIDAPGTGFSRMTGKDPGKAFWGVKQDGHAFARFIQRFLSQYNRWNSPKYIMGESYGTTRSAVVANYLENDYNIDLNGVILLSQIFNFDNSIDGPHSSPGTDLPYELALPTYAATAMYHHIIPQQPLQPFLKQVEAFAMGPYAHALLQGTDLSHAEKQSIAEKMHQYTGLPVGYLMRGNLRISGGQFEKTLQRATGTTTGRLDTRFSGPTIDPLSESAEYDPQSNAISSAYISLFNQYVRDTLHYGVGMTYVSMSNAANDQWQFVTKGNTNGLNVGVDLAMAMKTDPKLKVMVNGGYYDLATPFYAALYDDKHLPIETPLAKNIQYHWYKSGHMVYVRTASLVKLHNNVAAFIRSTEAGNE
jgi:carboxypeptidase C (cathepsin A)